MCCESIDVRRRCWKFSSEDERAQRKIVIIQKYPYKILMVLVILNEKENYQVHNS